MIGAVHKREPSFLLLLVLMMMLMLLLLANITESHSDTTYSSVPHKCLAGCRKSGPVFPCSRKHGGWGEKGACIHEVHGHAMPLFFTFSHTNRKPCLHGSHQGSLLLVRLDAAAALRHLEHHHGSSSSSRRHLHAHADYGQRSMYSAGSSALRL